MIVRNSILNTTPANVNWHSIPDGLVELRTLRSFRRHSIQRDYIDPYVAEIYHDILPQGLHSAVFDYHRPAYDPVTFESNLLKFKSSRTSKPEDWDSFNNQIESDYHYPFTSLGFDCFNKLDTNWQAAAGFGYGAAKKGDPGVVERAYRTASVLGLNHRLGIRLTIDQYTPDLALCKPEPSPSDKSKLRPVWGVAFHNWILSALSGQPCMKAAPSIHDGYPCIHNIDPTLDIPQLYSRLDDKFPDYHWFQLDWSSLDADVQLFESDTYEKSLRSRVSFNGDELAASAFEFSQTWRPHGTVVSPSGVKYVRNGNVGSGDSLTYHKDSEVTSRRLRYLLRDFESDYCHKELFILTGGDDGIIGSPSNVCLPLPKLKFDAKRIFNAKLNSEKFEYRFSAKDLSLFKVETNPVFHAQRKKDTVSVLGRTLVPLGLPASGALSCTRLRMINEVTGWTNNYLVQAYSISRSRYGEVDRSELPPSWLRSLERAGALKAYTPGNFSLALGL